MKSTKNQIIGLLLSLLLLPSAGFASDTEIATPSSCLDLMASYGITREGMTANFHKARNSEESTKWNINLRLHDAKHLYCRFNVRLVREFAKTSMTYLVSTTTGDSNKESWLNPHIEEVFERLLSQFRNADKDRGFFSFLDGKRIAVPMVLSQLELERIAGEELSRHQSASAGSSELTQTFRSQASGDYLRTVTLIYMTALKYHKYSGKIEETLDSIFKRQLDMAARDPDSFFAAYVSALENTRDYINTVYGNEPTHNEL